MFSGCKEWYNKRTGNSVKKKMKKIRRLITNPYTKEIKMTTLYEYPAKVGTTGSTKNGKFPADKKSSASQMFRF